MKTGNGEPIGEVPQKKDPYWWMHPAYRGEQVLDLDALDAMQGGGYKWTEYVGADPADENLEGIMQQAHGGFAEFAQLLYKVNGFRPGPVKNWYVIICVERDRKWAVGQLRADPVTPVQVFADLVFDSEDEARTRAESLRNDPAGNAGGDGA